MFSWPPLHRCGPGKKEPMGVYRRGTKEGNRRGGSLCRVRTGLVHCVVCHVASPGTRLVYSHRTREGGREEGRRGERGGFSRGRAKQGVLALAGLGRSDTCIQDGRSPGASRVIGIQGRGSKKRDDGKTGEKVEMKIHQRFPNPGHCRLRGGLSGGGGHQPWERAWALIAGQTPRTGSGGNNHGGRA